jgi:hypothetical protein
MELSEERISGILKETLEVAKMFKEQRGYRKDFQNIVLAFSPELEVATVPVSWRNNVEKRVLMQALAKTARDTKAVAIAMVTDARWLRTEDFAEYFHLPKPGAIPNEEWLDKYHEILNGMYGGSFEYLPKEVVNESLLVAIKGPAIQPRTLSAPYTEGPNDTIKWVEGELHHEDATAKIGIIPDWWDEPTGKPN